MPPVDTALVEEEADGFSKSQCTQRSVLVVVFSMIPSEMQVVEFCKATCNFAFGLEYLLVFNWFHLKRLVPRKLN